MAKQKGAKLGKSLCRGAVNKALYIRHMVNPRRFL